jgi:uncharacterized protein YqkB
MCVVDGIVASVLIQAICVAVENVDSDNKPIVIKEYTNKKPVWQKRKTILRI